MALDPRIRVVVAGNLVAVAARMSLVTFLGIYFVRERGIDIAFVGLAFLAENVARGLLAPFFGALSDRTGRRPLLITGLLANAAVLPCFLLIEGPASLFIWSLAMGLAGSIQFPAGSALLLDLAPLGRRQYVLAINYAAICVGYTVGVAPGGWLAELGYGYLATMGAVGYLAVAGLFARGLRGELPIELERSGEPLVRRTLVIARDRAFLGFAALAFIFPFGMGLYAFTLALFAYDFGLGEGVIGLILSANGLVIAALAVPVAARIEPAGPFRLLGLAGLALGGAYACFALVPGIVPALLAGALVFTLGELVFSSAVPAAVARLAPLGQRGAYQGAWSLVQSIAMGSAFYVSGELKELVSWRTSWLVFAGITLAAALALVLVRSRFLRIADARGRP
jgi:MFS family permease